MEHTAKLQTAPPKGQIESAYGVHSRMLLNVNLRVKADAKSGQLNYGNRVHFLVQLVMLQSTEILFDRRSDEPLSFFEVRETIM